MHICANWVISVWYMCNFWFLILFFISCFSCTICALLCALCVSKENLDNSNASVVFCGGISAGRYIGDAEKLVLQHVQCVSYADEFWRCGVWVHFLIIQTPALSSVGGSRRVATVQRTMRIQTANLGVTKLHRANIYAVGQTFVHETLPRQLGLFCPNHLNSSMAPIPNDWSAPITDHTWLSKH